jgi:hypothetical protein
MVKFKVVYFSNSQGNICILAVREGGAVWAVGDVIIFGMRDSCV